MKSTTVAAVVIALGLQWSAVAARAADAEDLAEGLRLFTQKGNCQGCHGWAGDGRKMDNQMPTGANLRESQLDRNNMVLTIKCGRPGRGMPAYDRLAYSDGRCYGQTKADLNGISLEDPPATLQPRDVETLVDCLFARVVKQGAMDRAKCRAYWGSDAEVCREFK